MENSGYIWLLKKLKIILNYVDSWKLHNTTFFEIENAFEYFFQQQKLMLSEW